MDSEGWAFAPLSLPAVQDKLRQSRRLPARRQSKNELTYGPKSSHQKKCMLPFTRIPFRNQCLTHSHMMLDCKEGFCTLRPSLYSLKGVTEKSGKGHPLNNPCMRSLQHGFHHDSLRAFHVIYTSVQSWDANPCPFSC